MYKIIIFSFLFFNTIISCSYLNQNNKLSIEPSIENQKPIFCYNKKNINFFFENENAIKFYQNLPFINNNNFIFPEKVSLFLLHELIRRPDIVTPNSRIQIFMKYKNVESYFDSDFINKSINKMQYMQFIEYYLNTFSKQYNLKNIIKNVDPNHFKTISISTEFYNFLKSNSLLIKENKFLAEHFLKGNELLTQFETFKAINLNPLLKNYIFQKNRLDPISLSFKNNGHECNIDLLNLKQDLFSKNFTNHNIGILEGDNYFIATISTQLTPNLESFKESYFLKSNDIKEPTPICQFKNNFQNLVLFSTSDRSPSQHLNHLVNYDIEKIDNFNSLEEILNFSRHIFLKAPDRILYESKKGKKSQLDFFQSLNIPIYHIEELGQIVGAGSFKNSLKNLNSLIIDQRGKVKIECGH